MKVILTLRIKRVYFNSIVENVKKYEIRRHSNFYQSFFNKKPDYIIFHYQSQEKIIVKVNNVRLVKTSKKLREMKDMNFGDKVYRVNLEYLKKSKSIENLKRFYQ